MKLSIIFLLTIIGSASWAQNNTENTATLIHIWGFLKYNHPMVASGVLDWDSEFIQKLNKIEQSPSDKVTDEIYLDWLSKLKTPAPCLSCPNIKVSDYAGNAVIDWNSHVALSTEVKTQLNYISENRNIGKNYYVQFHQKTKLPLFNNERKITADGLPNSQQRLLALARYWNAIQYFYPYKHLMSSDWNRVLVETIPLVQAASTELEFQAVLVKMNKELANSNAFVASELIFEKIGRKKVPFKIENIQDRWTVVKYENDSLAKLGALKLGDVIIQIDGVNVDQLATDKETWISASNTPSLKSSLGATLLNGESDTVNLQLMRQGVIVELTQKRFAIADYYWDSESEQNQLAWKIIDDKTIWLRVKDLDFDQVNTFQTVATSKRNLILDLRDYKVPSGFKLAEFLVPRSKAFAQMIEPNTSYVGKFDKVVRKNEIPAVKKFFIGNTYVLIDEKTRGQAELLTMLFKGSDRITLIGKGTSGTLGYTTKLVLPGDIDVFFTGVGVQNAEGGEVQQKGIQPDINLEIPFADETQIAADILQVVQKP